MSSDFTRKIKSNTIYNIMKTVSTIVFPLIIFPYTSRVLQPDNLGRVNFVNSIISYISLISSLGVTIYAIRECAKVQNDKAQMNKLANQIFSINICSTFMAYCVLIVAMVVSARIRNEYLLIGILCSTVLFQTLGTDWINTAMGDLKYISQRTVIFQLISILLIIAFVHDSDDYLKYAIISAGASVGANIANMFYRRRYCKIQITFDMDFFSHMRPIILLFALTFSQTIFLNLDTTMIGFFCGDTEVGIYSVAVKIYNLASTIISAILVAVIPQLSFAYAQYKVGDIRKIQKYALNYIAGIGIPIIAGINMIPSGIITLVAGESYLGAVSILRVLSISLILVMFGGAFLGNIVLLPIAKEKVFMQASLIATLVNAVLNYLLIPRYGIVAASVTTVISEALILIILLLKARKYIYVDSILHILIQPVVGVIPFVLVKYTTNSFIKNTNLNTSITIIMCVIVYFMVLYLLKNEFLLDFLESIKKRGKKL